MTLGGTASLDQLKIEESSHTLVVHLDGLVSPDNALQQSRCSGGGIGEVDGGAGHHRRRGGVEVEVTSNRNRM
jgi:hypothetical protein